ncbi:GNAT family N-acetyltransferase [Microlunatus parietis]|uniref:RimJ/RimL family protein N-acetyltransferase n=1 Tax=Microlunatus parietis TaxID=682979 RepID=A0A7Y9LFP4_9ACTN|nr:GNAT family N-acetyltransferase [Microlunatus parietis]NYE75058.1 RimJ/RimL family protein N-acetyltransferase [Microlunatus parietis]
MTGFPALRTRRLTLRPVVPEDAEAMVAVLADPLLYTFTGGSPPDLDQLRDRYRRLAGGRSPDGAERWLNWIVRLDEVPIGVVQATVRPAAGEADVAWEIGTAWQGRGYASEAAAGLVDWLLADGVRVVGAYVHPEHVASQRVAARAGLSRTEATVDGEQRWVRTAS